MINTILSWIILVIIAGVALGTFLIDCDKRRMSDKSVTRWDLFKRQIKRRFK